MIIIVSCSNYSNNVHDLMHDIADRLSIVQPRVDFKEHFIEIDLLSTDSIRIIFKPALSEFIKGTRPDYYWTDSYDVDKYYRSCPNVKQLQNLVELTLVVLNEAFNRGFEAESQKRKREPNIMTTDQINNTINANKHNPEVITDDIGDGFHTFGQLYFQRMMLFATLVNLFPELSWKTKRHEDGEECFGGDWFLVTIETPAGPYGYHYEMKYWDMFKCDELDKAKHWDGYTEENVDRLLSLTAYASLISYVNKRFNSHNNERAWYDGNGIYNDDKEV